MIRHCQSAHTKFNCLSSVVSKRGWAQKFKCAMWPWPRPILWRLSSIGQCYCDKQMYYIWRSYTFKYQTGVMSTICDLATDFVSVERRNSRTDMGGIFKLGGGVEHVTHHVCHCLRSKGWRSRSHSRITCQQQNAITKVIFILSSTLTFRLCDGGWYQLSMILRFLICHC